MIAPADAVAQVQNGSTRPTRVAIPPGSSQPTSLPNNVSDENRLLNAPLAHFDDGFSSDQGGGFQSGAETEREVTPTTDRDDSPDRTPVHEHQRRHKRTTGHSSAAAAAAAFESPLSVTETGEQVDDVEGGGGGDDEDDGDIVKTAKITISPPKDAQADEARASLLQHQHDSPDMDVDEMSSASPPPPPPPPPPLSHTAGAPTANQVAPIARRESMSGSSSPNAVNQQLRQQYEIQAVSRPRATTPVSSSAIESFVAVNPRRISDAEKMKISLPNSSFVPIGQSTTPTVEPDIQPEEPKHTNSGGGNARTHRRRSSMSWSEFQENMAAPCSSYGTASGRASGRTTPLSSSGGPDDDDRDLLEQNPVYQDRVPPSPVVHRRASREWVGFEPGEDFGAAADGEFKPPPLAELASEIQQTVNAWQHSDYDGAAASDQPTASSEQHQEQIGYGQPSNQEYAGYEYQQNQYSGYGDQGQEQYAPPPFDSAAGAVTAPSAYGDYGHQESWQQQQQQQLQQQPSDQSTYSYQQDPPQEPYYGYGSQGGTDQQHQQYSNSYGSYGATEASAGVSTYEYETNYPPAPPPPPPAPTSAYMDDWGSTPGAPTGVVNTNAWDTTTTSMQYAQPAAAVAPVSSSSSAAVHDDWDNSPYAHLQLSYQQQEQQQQQQAPPPPEPVDKSQQRDLVNEQHSNTAGAPARPAPAPPKPSPAGAAAAAEEPAAVVAEEKPAVSEEWAAYERMTQKMNLVVKHTQESLLEIKKETVAKELPSTPYEVAIGHVTSSSTTSTPQSQSQRSAAQTPAAAPAPPVDLLSSDFEPTPPTVAPEQASLKSSSSGDGGKEWKPIHEVLNDEIKKQKELQKPKRPPPPKAPPQRPPRPGAGAGATTTTSVPSSWDDAPAVASTQQQQHAPSTVAYPSWDNPNTPVAQSNAGNGAAAAPRVDRRVPEAPSVPFDSSTIMVPTQAASLSNLSPIDYPTSGQGHSDFAARDSLPSTAGGRETSPAVGGGVGVPIAFDTTDFIGGVGGGGDSTTMMDASSMPYTNSDIANQNHLQWNEQPPPSAEDDALFDTSKYSEVISGEATGQPRADDFDIFLKSDKPSTVPTLTRPPAVPPPPPPMPPPRSPGPERMFIIEKDTPLAVRNHHQQQPNSATTVNTTPPSNWADFDTAGPVTVGSSGLPPSESDFYLKMTSAASNRAASSAVDPFAPQKNNPHQPTVDLLGSVDNMDDSYDPFAVKSPDQIVAEAKAMAQAQLSAREANDDLDFFGGAAEKAHEKDEEEGDEEDKDRSSPGFGFRDDFAPPAGGDGAAAGDDEEDVLPLYDEDDSLPLVEFPLKFTGDGWDMMLRFPVKKKMMAERCWKPVYVRLQGANVELYYGKNDRLPFQTLPLLANYCLSDVTTQQYDVYGKIHTVKLQYVIYKEKVGIRPGQIPKLVEGHFTKLGLPLEHAAQTSVLLKFGSLHHEDMQSFVYAVEDILFHIPAMRERPALYKQDEIQVHCYDEYAAHVNKDGAVSDQRARVRLFCLSFVSGMAFTEIGLNDRRRQGKEVVRRKDIMPMYTERWIRFEALEFHSSVDKPSFDKEHVIKMQPLDACFFEVLRFRVRPPRGKELPLHVRSIMKIAGSKIEIRIEAMVAVFKSRKARQVPCEDIQIRFPIPEAWIYLFREERHWGYGSVHAKIRRPGKVKNIKDKIMGMVQNTETSLIEVAIGDAKYEHVYRSLVWRIPRLPEKHHGAYKTHLLRCRFELSSFDLMPETFIPNCEVEYTMPMATVSHTVVRSVSIEQHEDPDKVEKWVRYLAKYQYTVEVDYVQTTDLDIEAIMDTTVLEPEKSLEKAPVKHQPSLDVGVAKDAHDGYRIDFSAAEMGGGRYDKPDGGEDERKSSSASSDEEDARHSRKPPLQIDIKSYKY